MARPEQTVRMARIHDPAKGPFDPRNLEPVQDRILNPQGVRHPFKTEQDNMPHDERPRVKAALARAQRGH